MLINNANKHELLVRLKVISSRGFIKSVSKGSTGVGRTLQSLLGLPFTSNGKTVVNGLNINARRVGKKQHSNRVNLFAQVPNWSLSECKSTKEFILKYGYGKDSLNKRLNCTVTHQIENSLGLKFLMDPENLLLHEVFVDANNLIPALTWEIPKLLERMSSSHGDTFWIEAECTNYGGSEYFNYRYLEYSGYPRVENFPDLIKSGTITMDHLISMNGKRVIEKGPLFKIKPDNLSLLFPNSVRVDLITINDSYIF